MSTEPEPQWRTTREPVVHELYRFADGQQVQTRAENNHPMTDEQISDMINGR